MTRMAARELAVQMVYALDFGMEPEEMLSERLSPEFYSGLSGEDGLFAAPPGKKQGRYIETLVRGVRGHLFELDGYIEKHAVGWKFARLPRMAVALMRVCMYEVLYLGEVPTAAAVNAAVEISKKYEPSEVTGYINGILGSFVREEAPPCRP